MVCCQCRSYDYKWWSCGSRNTSSRWRLASTSERSDWRRRGLGIDVLDGEWNVVEPPNSGSGKQLSAANGLNPGLFSISPKNIQNVFCLLWRISCLAKWLNSFLAYHQFCSKDILWYHIWEIPSIGLRTLFLINRGMFF